MEVDAVATRDPGIVKLRFDVQLDASEIASLRNLSDSKVQAQVTLPGQATVFYLTISRQAVDNPPPPPPP